MQAGTSNDVARPLTIGEAAFSLGVSVVSVRTFVQSGLLKHDRRNGKFLFDIGDVEARREARAQGRAPRRGMRERFMRESLGDPPGRPDLGRNGGDGVAS